MRADAATTLPASAKAPGLLFQAGNPAPCPVLVQQEARWPGSATLTETGRPG